jgi:phage baseplate assembly protein V
MRKAATAITNMIARGVVAMVNAGSKMQGLQLRLTAGEIKGGVEHFEPYGYTSHPLPGAEALVVFVGGDRSHGVAIVVGDRKFRLQGLKPGEVALYSDEGDTLIFKRGREVELATRSFVVNATEQILLNAPVVRASEALSVGGKLEAEAGASVAGLLENNGVDVGSEHDHDENDNGGPTGSPRR